MPAPRRAGRWILIPTIRPIPTIRWWPVPTLPIGGGSYPLDGTPGVVCADVSWLWPSDDPSVPEGVSVLVTGYVVDPPVFEPADAACDGESCLDGFVFTADSLSCKVAMLSLVPWTDDQEGENAVLRLSGEMSLPGRALRARRGGW